MIGCSLLVEWCLVRNYGISFANRGSKMLITIFNESSAEVIWRYEIHQESSAVLATLGELNRLEAEAIKNISKALS